MIAVKTDLPRQTQAANCVGRDVASSFGRNT